MIKLIGNLYIASEHADTAAVEENLCPVASTSPIREFEDEFASSMVLDYEHNPWNN